jgi:hypothetical protein
LKGIFPNKKWTRPKVETPAYIRAEGERGQQDRKDE